MAREYSSSKITTRGSPMFLVDQVPAKKFKDIAITGSPMKKHVQNVICVGKIKKISASQAGRK